VYIGESDMSFGTSEEIVLVWWGPNTIPKGHILESEMNTIVCHPEEEDTLMSDQQCSGWLKLVLLNIPAKEFVADLYSDYGKSNSLVQ